MEAQPDGSGWNQSDRRNVQWKLIPGRRSDCDDQHAEGAAPPIPLLLPATQHIRGRNAGAFVQAVILDRLGYRDPAGTRHGIQMTKRFTRSKVSMVSSVQFLATRVGTTIHEPLGQKSTELCLWL